MFPGDALAHCGLKVDECRETSDGRSVLKRADNFAPVEGGVAHRDDRTERDLARGGTGAKLAIGKIEGPGSFSGFKNSWTTQQCLS